MDLSFINKDILSDKYGDVVFDAGDVVSTEDKNVISKCNCAHRIMSAYGDMKKYPLYGASLEEFIGKKINDDLVKQIEDRIKDALTEDRFLGLSDIDCASITDGNKIFVKISTNKEFGGLTDAEFSVSFDPINGVIDVFQ